MMTMSKPLSAGQAQRYHHEQLRDVGENYYSEGQEILGEWHGRLAAAWGLEGPVDETQFARLTQGQHPISGDQNLPPHERTGRCEVDLADPG